MNGCALAVFARASFVEKGNLGSREPALLERGSGGSWPVRIRFLIRNGSPYLCHLPLSVAREKSGGAGPLPNLKLFYEASA
jgi:hypothetical protein